MAGLLGGGGNNSGNQQSGKVHLFPLPRYVVDEAAAAGRSEVPESSSY